MIIKTETKKVTLSEKVFDACIKFNFLIALINSSEEVYLDHVFISIMLISLNKYEMAKFILPVITQTT